MALGAPCGIPQAWLPLRVTSSPEARRLVRARGGTLYLTLDPDGGGPRISTEPPAEPVDTDGFDGGGYLLVLDRRLRRPDAVVVDARDGVLSVDVSR